MLPEQQHRNNSVKAERNGVSGLLYSVTGDEGNVRRVSESSFKQRCGAGSRGGLVCES